MSTTPGAIDYGTTYSPAQQSSYATTQAALYNQAAQEYAAQQAAMSQMYSADQSAAASEYGSQAQKQSSMYGTHAQKSVSEQQLLQKQNEFNQVMGLYNQQASASGGASPVQQYTGSYGQQQVYTPQQTQQQVNQTVAYNDAKSQSQQNQNAASTAGRYGSSSPLLASLNGQTQYNDLQANNQAMQAIPFQAAQANQAASNQYAQNQLGAYGTYTSGAASAYGSQLQSQSAMLQALAGMA